MTYFWENIKRVFFDIKILYREHRFHFLVSMCLTVLAILIALNNSTSALDIYSPNFIVLIVSGTFNPLAFLLKLFIYGALLFSFLFIASMHFGFYILSYSLIYCCIYKIMLVAFVSCVIDGFSGIILAIFCYLPICLLGAFLFSLSMLRVYLICNYSCGFKHFNNLRYYAKNVFNDIIYPYILFVVISSCWWLLLFALFSFFL